MKTKRKTHAAADWDWSCTMWRSYCAPTWRRFSNGEQKPSKRPTCKRCQKILKAAKRAAGKKV